MSIEDIKGYKPHTNEKISKVNEIKNVEVALGLIFKSLEDEILKKNANDAMYFGKPDDTRLNQIRIAQERLKEASMWACRAVFEPEEQY